jgi:hypothetical protein
MTIRKVNWSVEPSQDTPKAIEAADFIQGCINDMSSTWANTISEILSMLSYGFSFHEILYKVRRGPNQASEKYKSKYNDGKIGWRDFAVRSQQSLGGWDFDEYGNTVAFVQLAEPDFKERVIPLSKGLLFRTKISRGNPEGRSLLRNAYRPWYFKKHLEEIEGIGIERDLAGFPMLEAPENLDLWNEEDSNMVNLRVKAEQLVQSIRRDSEEGVLLPFGWKLSLLSTQSSRQIDIDKTINRYDMRIAITLLADLVLLGGHSGSFALAETKHELLNDSLQSQLDNISDVINTNAVLPLVLMNGFDPADSPKIVPSDIHTPSLKEIALMLRAMNVDISSDMPLMNALRKVLNMPKLDKELFEKVYEPQVSNKQNDVRQDDSVSDTFEQGDMR